jgi:hypothetical protein
MQNETVVCNTITFGISIDPPADIFAQPFIVWEHFLSTPNSSILVFNASMLGFSNQTLFVSFFLLDHLQNKTIIFDSDFRTLY